MTPARAGALVPAGWGAYNGVWLVVEAGFGAEALPLWLYAAAITLVELAAIAVLLAAFRHPFGTRPYEVPTRGELSLLTAVGVVLVGLGAAYGAWFYPIGSVTLAWAFWLLSRDLVLRRRSLR